MKMSLSGIELLIQLEGIGLSVYKDSAGLKTIGIGHLLTQSELSSGKIHIRLDNRSYVHLRYGKAGGITKAQAIVIMQQDLVRFVRCVDQSVNTPLNQNQFNALVSFAFNVGEGAFKKSTLLKQLNQGQHETVPAQLKRWVRAGGKKIKGLVNRRNAEISLWNTPVADQLNTPEFQISKAVLSDRDKPLSPIDENYQIIKSIALDLGVWGQS